jgi:hypothetical protein
MIHETVAYINALIDGLGVFPVRYGITTLEQGEDFTAPAIYKGGGDSEQIGFDFNQAQVYHRILSISREEVESDTGCGLNVTQSTSMKAVFYFSRNLYETDNNNIDSKVGQNVANAISQSNIKTLANALQVDYISVQINSINLDRYDVFGTEFEGVPFSVQSDYGLISIDYTIEISGDESCFLGYGCGDTELNIDELIIDGICPVVTIYNADGTINTTVAAGGSFTIPAGIMIKSYITTASATQTFSDFIGYDLENMYINLQGAGNMGHLAGLTAAKKMVTAWDDATGVMTFKSALAAGYQITVIGTM